MLYNEKNFCVYNWRIVILKQTLRIYNMNQFVHKSLVILWIPLPNVKS